MLLTSRPYRLFEINDQWWFPQIFRERVQATLTKLWISQRPPISSLSPSHLAASALLQILASYPDEFTNSEKLKIVDFGSGAGGPIPYIAQIVNEARDGKGHPKIPFIMTDLAPHLSAWTTAVREHPEARLDFVDEVVDATDPPPSIVSQNGGKILRTFCLCFHHFDDELAKAILRSCLESSDGFVIFEIQSRHISSFILMCIFLFPYLLLTNLFWFFHDPVHMFFTYICPIVPFVVVFDGIISSLRTRTFEEVIALMHKNEDQERWDTLLEDWEFSTDSAVFFPFLGRVTWIVGKKT